MERLPDLATACVMSDIVYEFDVLTEGTGLPCFLLCLFTTGTAM